MLETIREAAMAQLGASGDEEAIRDRHVAWAVSFMELAEEGRWGSEASHWIGRIDEEAPGIDAAVTHAVRTGDHLAVARIVAPMVFLGELLSAFPVMVRAWVRAAVASLAARPDLVPAVTQARVHLTDAVLTYYDGDHAAALERLAIGRRLMEPLGHSMTLGDIMLFESEVTTDVAPDDPGRLDALARGLAILDATRVVYQDIGFELGVGSVANSRAIVLADMGRVDESLAEFDRAIAISEQATPGGDMNAIVVSQAAVELQAGLVERANRTIGRCLAWRAATGVPDPWIDAFTLLVVAGLAVERSQFATAGRLVGVALQLQTRSGQRTRAWDASLGQTRVALDAASGGLAEGLIALGATMTADEAFELASVIVGAVADPPRA
jgi:hypothetical protein